MREGEGHIGVKAENSLQNSYLEGVVHRNDSLQNIGDEEGEMKVDMNAL